MTAPGMVQNAGIWRVCVFRASLFFQGYFGDITNPEDSTDGLHFLPHTTFRALKSCTSQADCGPQKNLEEMLQKLLEEMETIKAELKKQGEQTPRV